MDAWILNLDAELELSTRGPYTPGQGIERAVESQQGAAATILSPWDVRVSIFRGAPCPAARGLVGRAWCMTPRARNRLLEVGARPVDSPPPDVLRRVNGRAFAASLAPSFPGALMVHQLEAWREKIASESPSGVWLSKRELSMAGRGQRRVASGCVTEADLSWARASLRASPLRVEPWVEVELELSLHGWVSREGGGWRGPLCVQRCDARGAWRETRLASAGEVDRAHVRELERGARRVADALRGAGYFGPFGVDAFLYRDGLGSLRLNGLSEINARYSMGWSVARAQSKTTVLLP